MNVICPYCNGAAKLVTGHKVYPHRPDLADLKVWACFPCDAWVGTHKNSKDNKPMGRLANAELRRAKMQAHGAFDWLWSTKVMTRESAYALLAEKMGLPKEQAHIGMFDVEQCKKVVLMFRPQVWLERPKDDHAG